MEGTRIAVLASLLMIASAQLGEFPSPTSVALNKPVSSTSSCGMSGAVTYCRYTTNSADSLAPNCLSTLCDNSCPFSDASPVPQYLALNATLGPGVTEDVGRPGSTTPALQLSNSFVNVSTVVVTTDELSFGVWLKQNPGNKGAVLSRPSSDGLLIYYSLLVSETNVTFEYLTFGSSTSSSIQIPNVDLSSNFWHHVAFTVYREDFAFYINGSVVHAEGLQGRVTDMSGLTTYLGQRSPGVSYYQGLVQDALFYNQSLTQREVVEIATGAFPAVHLSSECRCPSSHPVINSTNCVQHTGTTVNRGATNRLNAMAHPAGYINDNSFSNNWISTIGERQVNISLRLIEGSDLLYDLIFIFIRFGAPAPRAAVLEKSVDGGITYTPLQYFADDCMRYFNIPNDAPLTAPNGVNCITEYSTQTPTSGTTARVRFLDPNVRPGDLNTSPELRNFILASDVQLRLIDFFNESTTPEHRYYSIAEVSIAARCSCNGHASQCSSDRCVCVHNTQGDRCERCLPLYNDKPWRVGSTANGFPCKLCNCNNHATSCTYNSTIDTHPNDYMLGGGGVCDNCQDNTDGQNCETCVFGYFRPAGVLINDSNSCSPCQCNVAGSVMADCVKNEGIADQIAGQCTCKTNVVGIKCADCKVGFFDLRADRPEGCLPCDCSTAGTVAGSVTCNQLTGQCSCKTNVEGLKCDRCRNGTSALSANNPDGCSICTCNNTGSLTETCDTDTGLCTCKPGVGGVTCDQCMPGFFGFSDVGCQPCNCFSEGSTSNECNAVTGACSCLPSHSGLTCGECASGRYNLTDSCPLCACDTAGTVAGQENQCNQSSGQCNCKTNVGGRTCNACLTNFTNIEATNIDGCSPCDCFAGNIDPSSTVLCHPISQQCECLSSATGLDCRECASGFYMNDADVCLPCSCNSSGAVSNMCNTTNGQCDCVNSAIMGRTCDQCRPGFYQFPSCLQCQCNAAGSISSIVCDAVSGECHCKPNVEGMNCDTCKTGFQLLQQENPFGCSAAPQEQAPPTLLPLSSSTVLLRWLPPETPNGVVFSYRLFRGGVNFANTSNGAIMNYTDTGLLPNTVYLYAVESVNIIGSAKSDVLSVRTQEAPPKGVSAPNLTPVNSTAVHATWQSPTQPNGIIVRYELRIVAVNGQLLPQHITAFTGLELTAVASNLLPFTTYNFVVAACTSGGCTSSSEANVRTFEDAPLSQPAPNVTAINSTAIALDWASPDSPNGIITNYIVIQRPAPFTSAGAVVGNVSSTTTSVMIGGLQPFTLYEYSIVSHTRAGSTQSDWTRESTLEAAPIKVQLPLLMAIGPTQIRVEWVQPLVPNGIILKYEVYQSPSILLTNTTETGSQVVSGLSPSTMYQFFVNVCTAAGCTSSAYASVTTSESAPIGLATPSTITLNSTSIQVQWTSPTQPNGNISGYILYRHRPSIAPSQRDRGVAFYGTHFASFPPSTHFSGFNSNMSLWFRTSQPTGVLVYSVSDSQTDFMAVELREGIPWFLFNLGSGTGTVRPTANITFDDGTWHKLTVTRAGKKATITVDDMYSGSGSSSGDTSFLGVPSVVYVGGLAEGAPFTFVEGSPNPAATLNGGSLTGCLFRPTFNGMELNFDTQLNPSSAVGLATAGCPINLESGVTFIGGGFLQLSPVSLPSGTNFVLSLDFRTTGQSGLLFFAYGTNSHLILELINATLFLRVKGSNTNEHILQSSSQTCNGLWHRIQAFRESDGIILNIDGQSTAAPVNNLNLSSLSSMFLGGAHSMAQEAFAAVTGRVVNEFSGCMRQLNLNNVMINMYGTRETSELVRFGGCENSSEMLPACSGDIEINVGLTTSHVDSQLSQFTEYLYQVSAVNSAGAARSNWSLAMTQHSAPSGVGQVTVTDSTSTSISLSWEIPSKPNGVIVRYLVTGTPVSTVGLLTVPTTTVTQELLINEPEMNLTITLSGLQPATNYSLVLTAATNNGENSGMSTYHQTGEDVPVSVQAPFVTARTSSSFTFSWNPPIQPNGNIISYHLFIGNTSVSAGTSLSTTISNLAPFTSYQYYLQACTTVGCATSSVQSNSTLPDSPAGVSPPMLTALSPTTVRATWTEPVTPNGIITSYSLVRLFGAGLSQQEMIFTGLQLHAVAMNLSANTVYFFIVIARTDGGNTSSIATNVTTPEDIPDCIIPPVIAVVNSTALSVSWQAPCEPNGVITGYRLIQGSQEIFAGLEMMFVVTSLVPFTEYSFTIMACTVKGCGSSSPTTQRTAEAIPTNYVEPNVTDTRTSTATIVINPVMSPNGVVQYSLSVMGEFLLTPTVLGGMRNSTVETREVYNAGIVGTVVVDDLVPFYEYQCVLVVTNSAGNLTGNVFTFMTAAAAPEDLASPAVSLLTATMLSVVWQQPNHLNGILTGYQVAITAPPPGLVVELEPNITATVLSDLPPFTDHMVTVTAMNSEGNITSVPATIKTGEITPSSFDQIVALTVGSREIDISWDPPGFPNGIIVNYTVLLDDEQKGVVDANVSMFTLTQLEPFTGYNISVEACNSVGCVESSPLQVMTAEDVPENMSAPSLSATANGSIVISWQDPLQPHGIILRYKVERTQNISQGFSQVTTTSSGTLDYTDTDVAPYTVYWYRVVVENSAGQAISPSTTIQTPQSAPDGVQQPVLMAVSFFSILVTVNPPTQPNGVIIFYNITRAPSMVFTISSPDITAPNVTITDSTLLPVTNYTYTVTACTIAGCTTSVAVLETTLEGPPAALSPPITQTQSESAISVSWQPPASPNGVLLGYRLLRANIGYISSVPAPSCCEQLAMNITLDAKCALVSEISASTLSYTDSGLGSFSFYQYCVIAFNTAGSTYSNFSSTTQTQPALMPVTGPTATAVTINSTAIKVSWTPVDISLLLGPLGEYTLYRRINGGLLEEIFTGTDEIFVVSNLLPSTEYTFVVEVNNTQGTALGNMTSATTLDGIPENLPAPSVSPVNETAILIEWVEPVTPNGFIVNYLIFLDSVQIHNQTTVGSLVVANLSPFTLYSARITACTVFGCTNSPVASNRTLETAPFGLASPSPSALGPNRIRVTWSTPIQPNGIITSYRLYQGACQPGTLCNLTIIFTGLNFSALALNLLPFTSYGFRVEAINSAGSVFSEVSFATSDETAPSSVLSPFPLTVSASLISISWQVPQQPNGMITSYHLYRDGTQIFNGLATSFADSNLSPFTDYRYIVEACTNAGCTNSSEAINTTMEALPAGFNDPVVSITQARSLTLTWTAPSTPNGIILYYTVSLSNGSVVFNGTTLTTTITGLSPFTNYSFAVMVCNSAGCTQTNLVTEQTDEAVAEDVSPPGVRDLSTTSVEITWTQPGKPNGIITNYILRRDSTVVFQGLVFEFVDTDLVGDRLYQYTVEVVNSAGGTVSPVTNIRTRVGIPEGLASPNLTVISSTAILAEWDQPAKDNGMIFNYTLFVNQMILFMDIRFNYTITNLTPFTSYTIFIQACNQAGCASSTTSSAMTNAALPGIPLPPSLTAVGPNAVEVSWTAPPQPNGIISSYFIFRRLPGSIPLVNFQSSSPTSYTSTGLSPFTRYEFNIRVFNQIGSTDSEYTEVTTLEAIPANIAPPTFTSITATNITAQWSPPAQPNGIITSYKLFYRIPLDPVTNSPGTPNLVATVQANVTSSVATGLAPFTSYEFRIVAVNSAGEGVSEWELVTTGEALPVGISPIIVEMKTSQTLVLRWNPPSMPNGNIQEYQLFLDGERVFHNSVTTYTVMRLDPFTAYILRLSVCNSAGCTEGTPQSVTTLEAAPENQQSPTLTILTPYSLSVQWNVPLMPNGIITQYEVLRVTGTQPPPGNLTGVLTLFSTTDTSVREYNDTTILPASGYQYAIRSTNIVGETVSPFLFFLTPEAAPEGILAPTLSSLGSMQIRATWTAPTMLNGVISMYRLFRVDSSDTITVVYAGLNPSFVDTGLKPYTLYSYYLEACTGGGCGNGSMSTERTDEAVPEGFDAPNVIALSASNVSVTWNPPQTPNGIITEYRVTVRYSISNQLQVVQLVVVSLSTLVTDLPTFTNINVTVQACTSVGCITSEPNFVKTLEDNPTDIQPPALVALGPAAVQANWSRPLQPNGIILAYVLRRNDTIVYEGSDLSFTDTELLPFTYYTYDVQANNSAGYSQKSDASIVRTLVDTPTNVVPPMLLPLSSTSILAQWLMPSVPEGASISEYRLYVNDQLRYSGSGKIVQHIVVGLEIYTTYQFRLEACTTTCANSSLSSATTQSAPPEGQGPPTLTAQPNAVVNITWSPPTNPNGIITNYVLKRRQIANSDPTEVFSGLANSYLDQDPNLVPAFRYEYQVTVINDQGSSTSQFAVVVLLEEAPEGVPPLQLVNKTATTVTFSLSPPSNPNGNITQFRLYKNNQLVAVLTPTGSALKHTLTNQLPFRLSQYHFEACTTAGCTAGASLSVRTDELAPANIQPPVATQVMSRSMFISWIPPANPNGNLTRYTLWFKLSCLQPLTIATQNGDPCRGSNVYQLLTQTPPTVTSVTFTSPIGTTTDPVPHTNYQFIIQAENLAGAVNSSDSLIVTTPSTAPELNGTGFIKFEVQDSIIYLDWRETFLLNGILQYFIVVRDDGVYVDQRSGRVVTLAGQPRGRRISYFVRAVTADGQIDSPPIYLQLPDTPTQPTEPPTNDTVGPTPSVTPSSIPVPFYQQIPFIVAMVILGLLPICCVLVLILVCCRPKDKNEYKVDTLKSTVSSPDKEPGTVRGSWTRDLSVNRSKGEVPTGVTVELEPTTRSKTKKSYSPAKTEQLVLDNPYADSMLQDTHIARLSQFHPKGHSKLSTTPPSLKPSFFDDSTPIELQETFFMDTKI